MFFSTIIFALGLTSGQLSVTVNVAERSHISVNETTGNVEVLVGEKPTQITETTIIFEGKEFVVKQIWY